MTDYYSLMSLAVSRLPSKTDEARHGIYERARIALQETLRTLHPPISETEIANEQAVLDAAILHSGSGQRYTSWHKMRRRVVNRGLAATAA